MSYLKPHMSFSMTRKASWISWKIKKVVIWTKILGFFFQQILPLKSLSMNSSSSSDCSASKCVSSLSSRWLWSRELEWDEFDEPTEKKNSKHYEILGPTHFQNVMLLFTKGDHCPNGSTLKQRLEQFWGYFFHLMPFLSYKVNTI